MDVDFSIIIPARFSSSRLPGKPLLKIGEKSLVQHVYDAACLSDASEVVIATDNKKIEKAVKDFGARVVMTSESHMTGTDRIAEALQILGYSDDKVIVNVQGDEFGLQPKLINSTAEALNNNPESSIATLCQLISNIDTYHDPNSIKVILDKNNFALYFSRSPIPWIKAETQIEYINARKHIGIYAYKTSFIKHFSNLPKVALEKHESLEQLRALFNGYKIYVELVSEKEGIEINTEDDLKNARMVL
ncbi:MAG: 3-deoxy-manno-octulosonate cytidylyltransferase [Gammaproteobacteria bacterium]